MFIMYSVTPEYSQNHDYWVRKDGIEAWIYAKGLETYPIDRIKHWNLKDKEVTQLELLPQRQYGVEENILFGGSKASAYLHFVISLLCDVGNSTNTPDPHSVPASIKWD